MQLPKLMQTTASLAVSAAALAAFAASPAVAQITPTSSVVLGVFDLQDPPASGGLRQPIADTFAATGSLDGGISLNLSGHAIADISPGQPSLLLSGASVVQQFDVGPVPVEVNPELFEDYKIVLSGGDLDAGRIALRYNVRVFESGSLDVSDGNFELGDFDFLGTHLSVVEEERNVFRTGNGFTVRSQTIDAAPAFVLTPGQNYTMMINAIFETAAAGLDPADPAAAGIWEMGGHVSNFAGLTARFNARAVPEPAALATLSVTGGLLLRRRRVA